MLRMHCLMEKLESLPYDEQYNATWINDFLEERHIDIVGKKTDKLDFTKFRIYFVVKWIALLRKIAIVFMKFYVKKTDRFYL